MENLTNQPYEKLVHRLGELDEQSSLDFHTPERVAQMKREMSHIVFELMCREQELGLYNTEDLEDEQ